MQKLQCVECKAVFNESDIKSDNLLCPTCGARLEEFLGFGREGSRGPREASGRQTKAEPIRTHYDNLKVARNAPEEVIRAAYRSLSQKYHPDVNAADPNADRIMRIINAAYEVLSDPEKRKAHDSWIAQQEGTLTGGAQETVFADAKYASTTYQTPPKISSGASAIGDILSLMFRNWFWCLVAVGVISGIVAPKTPHPAPPGPKPYQAVAPAPAKPEYVRPAMAPNGEPWPASPGYVPGFKRYNANGRSNVTVDNTQNDSDAFVKLVFLGGEKAYPVRTFFIPGRGKFTVKKITDGSYDVRYRDLDSGHLFRSEDFTLEETRTETGVRFSNMRMTLYKVPHGNMKSFDLPEDEF